MYGCMVLMPLEACFTDHTSFVEVTEQVTIPAEYYQKMLLTLMCAMFVAHVMGEVSSINTVFDNENHSIHCVMITIQLDRKDTSPSLCNAKLEQTQDELDDFNAWLDISTLNQIRKVATQ
ncbi:hypothetical protein F2Q69_00047295 [Brassica cretica]|uniref:Uncharacterized protein n=1 Tax=Brassica cretica TaxID=69181 RepID=A0A8S9PUM2_BRACR|nr:hypothetical protein F2Q69_00047295 [Brassica cretica]